MPFRKPLLCLLERCYYAFWKCFIMPFGKALFRLLERRYTPWGGCAGPGSAFAGLYSVLMLRDCYETFYVQTPSLWESKIFLLHETPAPSRVMHLYTTCSWEYYRGETKMLELIWKTILSYHLHKIKTCPALEECMQHFTLWWSIDGKLDFSFVYLMTHFI